MSKTWLSALAAAVLVAVALAIFFGRWLTLGQITVPPLGKRSWEVTLQASGQMAASDARVITPAPPDFRQQHIAEEKRTSKELLSRVVKEKTTSQRRVVWRPAALAGKPEPFRLVYTFRCTARPRPTEQMKALTSRLDGPPDDRDRKAAPRIESDAEEIRRQAQELVRADVAPEDRARALFNFVARLDDEPVVAAPLSALQCLRKGSGDSCAKSRLLVALCRNRGLPARVMSGVRLVPGRAQGLHHWAEAWVNEHWLPMCPVFQYFGDGKLPSNYLVLAVGEDTPIRGHKAEPDYHFTVKDLSAAAGAGEAAAEGFWQQGSLTRLGTAEQKLVEFLLLLPLGALIVSVFRTVIGVPTFGTFTPALLGLVFLDLQAMLWGMPVLVVTVLIGWWMRHLIDRFHLLLVPRAAVVLTLIVVFLVTLVAVAGQFGVSASKYIQLFPLVILTHLVERFWTVETEDGAPASFRTLLGTLAVAITVSLALSPRAVGEWMRNHPETIGLVLAAQLLLGRYTGYRLTELYRFAELLKEEPPPGGTNELAEPLARPEGAGGAGHEPAQHAHPRPEPAGTLSPGGQQAAPAGPVSGDRGPHA
jgi:hypothetical protein